MPSSKTLPDLTGSIVDDRTLLLAKLIGVGAYGKLYRAVDAESCSSSRSSWASTSSSSLPSSSSSSTTSSTSSPVHAVKCLQSSGDNISLRNSKSTLHLRVSSHPNIVTMYRHFSDAEHTFLVMDFHPLGTCSRRSPPACGGGLKPSYSEPATHSTAAPEHLEHGYGADFHSGSKPFCQHDHFRFTCSLHDFFYFLDRCVPFIFTTLEFGAIINEHNPVDESAEPSQSAHASLVEGSSNSSFFHNKAAVAAVFTRTGLCTVVLTLWLLTCALRRRRRRQLEREMDVAGAFIPDAARRAIEADDYEKAAGEGLAYAQHSSSSSHPLRHPPGLAQSPNTVYAQWSSGYDQQQEYASGGAYIAPPAPVSLMCELPGHWVTNRDSPAVPVPLTPQVFDTSPTTVPSKDSDYLSKYTLSPPVSR
ncbi:hypothetical protein FB45DRAFT_1108379 [Roridomyces roridus]|uniref:Protein kinase domain-containing protein n=1 Tax=Roridomyces roridus TaxID=1738132 RepID=A0AAD7BBE2_9AGAR|nr:hypothetical protein FB45DRAFT_1108379 [Roridomyces roridus]